MANKYIYGQYTASINPLHAIPPSGVLALEKTLAGRLMMLVSPFYRNKDSLIIKFCNDRPIEAFKIPSGRYSSIIDLLKIIKWETLSATS